MENYVQIMVNGCLIYPKSLAGYVSRIHVNGQQKCYPDNAVCILKDLTVDKFFIIRAVQNTPYFITGKVTMIDPTLDLSILIQKMYPCCVKKHWLRKASLSSLFPCLMKILIFLLFPMISACCLILWN